MPRTLSNKRVGCYHRNRIRIHPAFDKCAKCGQVLVIRGSQTAEQSSKEWKKREY